MDKVVGLDWPEKSVFFTDTFKVTVANESKVTIGFAVAVADESFLAVLDYERIENVEFINLLALEHSTDEIN